jgi:capsular polysaccharide export protein
VAGRGGEMILRRAGGAAKAGAAARLAASSAALGAEAWAARPRRVLFASAPFGPFFADLAIALEKHGCEVWRFCFEGGDLLETPARNRIVVRGDEDFALLVADTLHRLQIDCVVTFNDILPRNRILLDEAKARGIERFVLENGYLRPHWVTLERDGVNGFSGLPRDRAFYLAHRARRLSGAVVADDDTAAQPFEFRVRYHVLNTIKHFLAAVCAAPFMSFDSSYYGESVWRQAIGYMKEFAWRKCHNEHALIRRIQSAKSVEGRTVFTVLMQKPGDGQLLFHSPFRDRGNNAFLREVIASFSRSAPKDAMLVVKQHPLDYGSEHSPQLAASLFLQHGISDRALYLRMTSIDICMDNSDGLVTVNSTGGLAALQKGLAVKCLGRAVYDVPGLTFQGGLDAFWREGRPAEPEVLEGYVDYLTYSSQLNGGFHTARARALLMPRIVRRLTGFQNVFPQ